MFLLAVIAIWFASPQGTATAAHATAETANCIAQGPRYGGGYCPTDTPVPTSTPEPTLTPTPVPTSTPDPADTPTPEATPTPATCWLTDPDYGDPDNNFIVFDDQGNPIPCYVDIAEVDDTPTPVPTDSPTQTPVVVMVPAATQPPQPPQTIYVQSTPQIVIQTVVVTVIPTATPMVPTPTRTIAPTQTASPTSTATATLTATATPKPVVTVASNVVPTPSPTPVAQSEPRIPTWLQGPLGIAAIALLLIAGIVSVPIFMRLFK